MSCCHLLEEFALRFWELRDLGDTVGLWLGFFLFNLLEELQNSIKWNYPNVVLTKLICSTFDQEGELSQGNKQTADEFNSQGKTMEETPLSAEPLQTDVEMTSLEEHGNVQHDKNGYFCR